MPAKSGRPTDMPPRSPLQCRPAAWVASTRQPNGFGVRSGVWKAKPVFVSAGLAEKMTPAANDRIGWVSTLVVEAQNCENLALDLHLRCVASDGLVHVVGTGRPQHYMVPFPGKLL